jgi:hypothetical protein
MKSNFKEISFFLTIFFLLPILAGAITFGSPFALPTFEELVDRIISFISWVAIAIVPIAIIIAAFYFLTSGGEPEKVRTAKRIIFYTIMGLIIILLARGISSAIKQIIVGPAGPSPSSNNPPTADARTGNAPNPTGKSVTVTAGSPVYFDGSTYSSDSDGTITKYEWDFKNDGTYDWSSTTTGKTTYIYSAGSYAAKLRITDDDGATATDTVSIKVNPAPALVVSITSPSDGQIFLQGTLVTFAGSASGGVAPYAYSWTSNIDGVIGNTLTFTKNNLSVGVHTITFKVTDSASTPVTVSNSITITITNDVTPPSIQNAKVNPTSGPSGTIFIITAEITDSLGVDPTTTIAHIQNPDEKDVAQVTLYDDGAHSDGAANDGIYGNKWDSTGFPVASYFVDITACDLIGNCGEAENI